MELKTNLIFVSLQISYTKNDDLFMGIKYNLKVLYKLKTYLILAQFINNIHSLSRVNQISTRIQFS